MKICIDLQVLGAGTILHHIWIALLQGSSCLRYPCSKILSLIKIMFWFFRVSSSMKYSLSSLLLQPKEEIPIKQLSIYVALHWYLHFNVFLLGVSLFGVSLLDVIILGVFVAPPFVRDSNQECRPEGSLSLQSVRWSGTRRSGIANTTKHQENRTDRELDSHSTHSRAPLLLSLSLSLSLSLLPPLSVSV